MRTVPPFLSLLTGWGLMSSCLVADASCCWVGLALLALPPPPPPDEPPHAATRIANPAISTAQTGPLVKRTFTARLLTTFVVCTFSLDVTRPSPPPRSGRRRSGRRRGRTTAAPPPRTPRARRRPGPGASETRCRNATPTAGLPAGARVPPA